MVAIIMIGLISAALLPVLVIGAKASTFTRLNTVAKNLTQQRIEAMRNLPFYVAYQNTGPNGQFYDVLDDYYANVSTTTTTFPNGGKGTWVQSGTGAGGAPTGPYYQVSFSTVPNSTGFSQVVYTQFLTAAQPVPAPVSASRLLQNAASPLAAPNYNSAAAGQDSPPSLLLGVTVITSWTWNGQPKSYKTYTEMADNGNTSTLISSKATATALSVSSMDTGGNQLTGVVGDVELTGTLANTSSASAEATAGTISQSSGTVVSGASSTIVSPPNPAGSNGATSAGQTQAGDSTSIPPCGWGYIGPTQVNDVSTTTAGGLPSSPSDVGTGSTPANVVEADLNANTGGSCSGFRFSNSVNSTDTTDPTLQLPAGGAMVQVVDTGGSGHLVQSKGSLNALAAAGTAASTTEVDFATSVALFPGLPFVQTGVSTCGSGTQTCGRGLVNIFLTQATLSCQASGTAPVASYAGYLTYWTQTGWHNVLLSWSSTSGSATDPLASVSLSQTVTTYGTTAVPLSAYINSWNTGRAVVQGSDGENGLPAVVAITTAPTRAGDSSSSIGLQVGKLSCTAVDNR